VIGKRSLKDFFFQLYAQSRTVEICRQTAHGGEEKNFPARLDS